MSRPLLSRRLLLKGACATALLAASGPVVAKVRRPPDPFIERLVTAMTLEEKAGQLSLYIDFLRLPGIEINPATKALSEKELHDNIAAGRITGLFNGLGAQGSRDLQRIAIEQSRLKIPLVFAGDIIHGLRTVFPVPLGESASFDTDLARRTARASAVEATAAGFHWTFAPMVDIARDQRWGRVVETSGEDTWLAEQFARARVQGFQGADLTASDSLLACPKHFAAYGAVLGGMDYATVDLSEITLRQTHLPPFKAAFEAGAITTMSSFNDINGVPATGNRHLLTEILRGEWGFGGLVVSDYTSEEEMIAHGFATDGPDAVVKALTAGCDMSMQSGLYQKHLPDLVRNGRIPMSVVDTAVRRVLGVKKALGLFEDPYRSLDPAREKVAMRTPDAIALAREAAVKSMVLLKNDNNLLPLSRSGAALALIGPGVDDRDNLAGPWSVFPDTSAMVTVEEGLRAAMGVDARLSVTRGCDYEASLDGGVALAVAAAKAADIIVMVMGESTFMSGEAQSRIDISIPRPQMDLFAAVAETGKPIVVLLRHGRALALNGVERRAQAIIATWFLGSETGNAVADILFGDQAPQGRLPVSFPQASGQQPYYYNHRSGGRPQVSEDRSYKSRYREVANQALYPFGHGLTYGTAVYSKPQVSAPEMTSAGSLKVIATIENRGRRRMHEVAQFYLRDRSASVTQPVRSLKGVKHVDLDPGQSTVVEFTVTSKDLAFVHSNLKTAAEPGLFDVWIAPSAETGEPATFVLKA